MCAHKLPSVMRCPAPCTIPHPPCPPLLLAAMRSLHPARQLQGVASQRLALHRGRRCHRVVAAAAPPPAPGGDWLDRPALRAYCLEQKVFGTASKEALDAAIAEHRRFEALKQPWREEQQARMEAHDRLLRTTPQEAAGAPSADTATPQQPTAHAPPAPSATNRPPLVTNTARAPSNALAAAAAAAGATALAFSEAAEGHRAAAKAAQSANQPELAAKELERAAAMWDLASAAWGLVSRSAQQMLQG